MRLFIASMPLFALTTIFVMTAQRVPLKQGSLRDSILPETLDLLRSIKTYHHTILDDINIAESRQKSRAAAPRALGHPITWSTANWAE